MQVIKSPFNYTGGKHKIVEYIINEVTRADTSCAITEVWDVFGGGFNVGINMPEHIKVMYTDIENSVVDILNYFKNNQIEDILVDIDDIIHKYKLSKTNREGYNRLREDWNKGNKSILYMYVLICYAFNNQIRYNKHGEYNIPFGKDRASFNENMREKLIKFVDKLHRIDSEILCKSYLDIDIGKTNKGRLYYCDPPYLNSVCCYTKVWHEENEKALLNWLEAIDKRGERFILSNNLQYDNELLRRWIEGFNVRDIEYGYRNSCYSRKDKSKVHGEILVMNY